MGLSSALERRASPENPSTSLANPAAWLTDYFGGGRTKAGTSVNESSSISISGVWAAVRLLANTVGQMPAIAYRRLPRGKERARDQAAHQLLHERPNPEMTPSTFKATLQAHAVLWGGGFSEIERNHAGRPVALWPLMPDRTTPERRNGQKVYRVRMMDGSVEYLAADRVMHIPGLSHDGVAGHRIIQIARESLGLTKAAEEFGSTFFGQGAQVSGALSTDASLSDKQRTNVRESWDRMHTGLSNAHRTALLEAGLKWQAIGIEPEKAQFLETRRFQVTEVARWFGVPPHMIGDLERATFTNVEQQGQEFVTYALGPWLTQWEETASYDLIAEGDRSEYFVEFLREALLRGDTAARGQFYRELFNVGSISPNEIREKENMNPVPGGDIYLVPLNMGTPEAVENAPVGGGQFQRSALHLLPGGPKLLGTPEPEPRALPTSEAVDLSAYRERRSIASRRKIREAFEPLLEDVGDVVFGREINAAARALDKAFRSRDIGDFDAWVTEFYTTYPEYATERFGKTIRAMSESIYGEVASEMDSDAEYSAEVEEFARRYTTKMGEREAASSVAQLRAIMRDTPPEEVEAALRGRLDEWKEKRAKKFAGREAARGANAMARESYRALGVKRLVWRTVGANCPLCSKLDGRTAEITGAFLRKGETVDPEDGETEPLTTKKLIRHPPLHGGCDCTIVPA